MVVVPSEDGHEIFKRTEIKEQGGIYSESLTSLT